MSIKRLILIVLTIVAIFKVILALGESLQQPQVQARLQLYQTNLILHASEYSQELIADRVQNSKNALIGNDPYLAAEKQYKEARQVAQVTLSQFQEQVQELSSARTAPQEDDESEKKVPILSQTRNVLQQQQLQQAIAEVEKFIDELDLKLGLIQIQRQEIDAALKTWNTLAQRAIQENSSEILKTTAVLIDLWEEPPTTSADAESRISKNLDGWFGYQALKRLYQLQGDRQADLLALESKEQKMATQAIFKLALISGIPIIGGIIGVVLLIFLMIQWLIQKERSLLATNSNTAWEVPWDGEIVWQVLIVGFFFVSQILLPILFGISGINPIGWGLRQKALYVLVSYLLLASGGLLVMYFSIKPYFPLPKNWFRFQLLDRSIFWGIGGYLVALPLVIVVSLINQELWDGQGGSNPLLFLALQAQDKVVLAIFFFTASIAAPIFEETIFRGFFLSSLTRYLPVWGSVLVSALVFSIAHLSLSEVLPLTTLGIILGLVYTRSRNLLAPILLHSLWNGGTLFSLFVLGSQ
jgi:uncharacterized protein